MFELLFYMVIRLKMLHLIVRLSNRKRTKLFYGLAVNSSRTFFRKCVSVEKLKKCPYTIFLSIFVKKKKGLFRY